MAAYVISPPRGAGAPLPRPADVICFALIVAQAVYLAAAQSFVMEGQRR